MKTSPPAKIEASFTKKGDVSYHGYKMHTATDASGIIAAVVTSTASHHDSPYIDPLVEAVGDGRAVFADGAVSTRSGKWTSHTRAAPRGAPARCHTGSRASGVQPRNPGSAAQSTMPWPRAGSIGPTTYKSPSSGSTIVRPSTVSPVR